MKNTCVESLFNKVALKFFNEKGLPHMYLPVNVAEFLRGAFVIKYWLVTAFDLTLIYILLSLSRSHHLYYA